VVTIRTETHADIPAVAALQVRAWRSAYAGMMPAEVLAALDPAERERQRHAWHGAEGFLTLVATDGPTVVGFATIGPYRNNHDRADLDPTFGEVLAIYVEPARIGTGIGQALMAAVLAELAGRGFREARLWVLEANHRSRRFYEKAGFTDDGERAAYAVKLPSSGESVLLPIVRYVRPLGDRG
jgi:ribosomal protein S18 acetylase RimI-like enzyme